MQKYTCPSCGAEIAFQSSISVSCVCPACRSLVVRKDVNLEAIGTMAELPQDISPLQIGSAGVYNGVHFGVIGRLKVGWEDGCWNEWFLYMDTGKRAWLAEAQGFFAIIFELEMTPEEARKKYGAKPALENKITIGGKRYTVSDIKDTECLGSEGELPFIAPKGRKVTAVDYVGGNRKFAGIEYCGSEPPTAFTGEYVEFDDLHLTGLRELAGWKTPYPQTHGQKSMTVAPGSVKTFNCPQCSGTINVRAVGISITAVCQNCGTAVDIANDNLSILNKAAGKIRHIFIPLGARGTLSGAEWEVIGYCERHAGNSFDGFSWEEYLLFNPWQGFRFLVQSDGHWTFVRMLRDDVELPNVRNAICNHKSYLLYSNDDARIVYVMGEFYWRVKAGSTTKVTDFIAAPYTLSREVDKGEVIWSQGVYVEPEEIRAAFAIQSEMPPRVGVAPAQPSPVASNLSVVMQWTGILLALLLLIQVVSVGLARDQTVLSRAIQARPEQKGQIYTSEPFTLSSGNANMMITVKSPVFNDWVEVNTSLTHEQTQETYETTQDVEYYYGRDSDGPWSEGKQINETMFSAVPGGRYRLLVAPDAGAYRLGKPADFTVTVKRDVPVWSNFWVALAALLVYPLITLLRHRGFERRRWENSDYAPQQYRSSGDD